MSPLEYVLPLVLLAWIVYQELSWRTRSTEMRSMLENRLAVESALAYRGGFAEGKLEAGNLKTFVFKRHEVLGYFRKRLVEFSIKLTLIGREVRTAEGDLSNIHKFEIPEDLKKLINSAGAVTDTAVKVIGASHGIPTVH